MSQNIKQMISIIHYTVSQKVSLLNILQQPLQTCTDLNEILHTQDDIYFCHRHQISYESLIPFTRWSILSNCCHKEVVREDCQARKLNKEDAMDRCKWRKMIRKYVDSDRCEWGKFLLVPAYPGCPGSKAVKRSLLLL